MAPGQTRRRSAAQLRPSRFPLRATRAARIEKLLSRAIQQEWQRIPEDSTMRAELKPLALSLSASLMAKITRNADVTTPSAPAVTSEVVQARARATAQRVSELTRSVAVMRGRLRSARARAWAAQTALLETPHAAALVVAVMDTAPGWEGARKTVEAGLGELNEHFLAVGERLATLEDAQPKREADLASTMASVTHVLDGLQEEAAEREAPRRRVTRATEATAALAEHLR